MQCIERILCNTLVRSVKAHSNKKYQYDSDHKDHRLRTIISSHHSHQVWLPNEIATNLRKMLLWISDFGPKLKQAQKRNLFSSNWHVVCHRLFSPVLGNLLVVLASHLNKRQITTLQHQKYHHQSFHALEAFFWYLSFCSVIVAKMCNVLRFRREYSVRNLCCSCSITI